MSTPRYEITRGGMPSGEQLAALAVALTPTAVPGASEDEPAASGWRRAAIWEAVGRRNFVSADDVDGAPPVFS